MIPVVKEPFTGPPEERCCFCRRPTKFWTNNGPDGVAVCEACALIRNCDEVPSKEAWFAVEGLPTATEKKAANRTTKALPRKRA